MLEKKWNSDWLFWKRLDSFALAVSAPGDAVSVSLPHDAMILEPPYAGSPNGTDTGFRDGGVYDYEKSFFVAEEEADDTFFLKLEGVYMNAMVYVNGALAARRVFGYSTFYVPLHEFLLPGRENTVRVEVRNSAKSNSRWYSGSGIYRDVYLLHAGTAYLAPESLQIELKTFSDAAAYMEIRSTIANRSTRLRHLAIRLTVQDPQGQIAAKLLRPLPLYSASEQTIRTNVLIPNAALWSDETPSLYTCTAELLENDTVIDESREVFGIRQMTLDARNGLRINGHSVKLRGACIHHDNGLLGAATHEDAEYRRIRLLKEAGFNAIRMSHNPTSQAMLRACDELGMYVMEETFDMWTRCKGDNDYALYFDKWWKEDVEAMVRKDYNHPSVILYSLGNEIPELGTDRGIYWLHQLAAAVKAMDTTRYTTVAINGVFAISDQIGRVVTDICAKLPPEKRPKLGEGGNVNAFMTLMDNYMDDIVTHDAVSEMLAPAETAVDALGYNYMTGRYTLDRETNPDRVIVGSETYPPQISRNWDTIMECPNVIGDFTWTGWDYIGEAGVGIPAYHFGEGGFGAQFPCQLCYVGDLDILGFRRPASYFREIVFGLRTAPYIAVNEPSHYGEPMVMKTNWVLSDSQSSWTWPGFEGKPVAVEVYSQAPEVELLINGSSIGKMPAGSANNYTARFELTYVPGTLTAVAWDGNTEIGRHELQTAGEASIVVRKESALSAIAASLPNTISAAGTEAGKACGCLHYFNITLEDAEGIVNTSADCEISVEVAGGTLLGLGSGNPKPLDLYTASKTHTWQGRAQAIVWSEGEPEIAVRLCPAMQ